VGPFGVDVCSGLRINGKLDVTKLTNFMHAVRASEALDSRRST
jgi:phosphoribosylanthranilate isomerase